MPHVGSSLSAVTFVPDLNPRRRGGLGRALISDSAWRRVLDKRLEAHRDELFWAIIWPTIGNRTGSCGGSASAWPPWPTSTTASSSTICKHRSSR